MGKNSFFLLIVSTYMALFIFLKVPFFTNLSFFANFLLLLGLSYYNIYKEQEFSPFLSVYIVFNLLFFVAAPLVQINEIVSNGFEDSGKFIQSFPFTEWACIRANIYIFFFNIILFLFYIKFKRILKFTHTSKEYSYRNIPLYLLILSVLTILIIGYNLSEIIFQYQTDFYELELNSSTSQYLIVQKFLYYLPFSGLILSLYYYRTKISYNRKYVLGFIILFLFFVLFLKNPLTEKRNALGPLYITILFLFIPKFLSDNFKVIRFMLLTMLFAFPLVSVLTHSHYSISKMLSKPILILKTFENLNITNAFNSLHYEAYANFLATIDYWDSKNVVVGEQLLCSLFFFVPRSIWEEKPKTTGFLIGDYLIDKYNFNFNNLSNPYISEAYINFGFIGFIIFALILAFIFVVLIRWLKQGDILKSIFAFYFSIYLMYFLRGDLTSSFAYINGFIVAVVVLPKYFIALINFYVSKYSK